MTFLVDNNLKATKVAATNDPHTLGLSEAQYLAKSGQTITLPAITASMVGRSFLVKLGEAHTSDVTIEPNGSDTIEGNASYLLTSDYGFVELIASTGKWLIVKASQEISNDEALLITARTSSTDPSILINSDKTSAASETSAVVLEVQRGTTGANAQLTWDETSDSWQFPDHNLVVGGNLTINGTTTTVNSTTTTVTDPIFTLGGDTAPSSDDNKDRGIEFRWHNGSAAKVGFFGFDDSAGIFTFIPDATNTSEVFSGTEGAAKFSTTYTNFISKYGAATEITLLNPVVADNTLTTAGVIYADGGVSTQSGNLTLNAAGVVLIDNDGSVTGDFSVQTDLSVTGTTTATGAIYAQGGVGTTSGNLTLSGNTGVYLDETPTLTDNSLKVATTEFVQKSALGVSTKTTNYTLVLTDAGKLIDFNSASNLTLTIPANSSVAFPIGTQIVIARYGTGTVTVAITTDTLRSASSYTKIATQYGAATLVKRTSTEWYLFGDLGA